MNPRQVIDVWYQPVMMGGHFDVPDGCEIVQLELQGVQVTGAWFRQVIQRYVEGDPNQSIYRDET